MLYLAEFKPSAGRILLSHRRPQFCGLAKFKPKLLLSRYQAQNINHCIPIYISKLEPMAWSSKVSVISKVGG